ncbi:hypothetical protein N7507_010302 [Penicillium longicatenatum]|nr:hypothetical protein N7507_010302 [Penicillium longicatenatum]
MSSNFQGPTWLREDASYNEYIRLGEKGELNFPEYEKDDEGRIIFHYGEAFCRWPECDRRMKRQEARDLRTHVKTHVGVSMLKPVAHPQFGKVRTQAKDQIRCKVEYTSHL